MTTSPSLSLSALTVAWLLALEGPTFADVAVEGPETLENNPPPRAAFFLPPPSSIELPPRCPLASALVVTVGANVPRPTPLKPPRSPVLRGKAALLSPNLCCLFSVSARSAASLSSLVRRAADLG